MLFQPVIVCVLIDTLTVNVKVARLTPFEELLVCNHAMCLMLFGAHYSVVFVKKGCHYSVAFAKKGRFYSVVFTKMKCYYGLKSAVFRPSDLNCEFFMKVVTDLLVRLV